MTPGAIMASSAQITDTVTYDTGLTVSTSDTRTAGVAAIPVTAPGTYSFSTTVTVPALGVCVERGYAVWIYRRRECECLCYTTVDYIFRVRSLVLCAYGI